MQTSHKQQENALSENPQNEGMQKGRWKWGVIDVSLMVSLPAALILMGLVGYALFMPLHAEQFFQDVFTFMTANFSTSTGFFANAFVVVCFGLMVSPWRKVRLGGKDSRPDFGFVAWFSMLFAAGMGIGLVFYGVNEPLTHYLNIYNGTADAPLAGTITITGNSAEAIKLGMASTILHWSLHPWAIYALLALSLALASYNFNLPFSVRTGFYFLFGKHVWGPLGHLIDILAILATTLGLATSLGYGANQALAGFNFLFGVDINTTNKIILVFCVAAITVLSLWLGVEKGVRRLSEVNMGLAACLCLFVLVCASGFSIIGVFASNIISYFRYLPALSGFIDRPDQSFFNGWTLFYWAWWAAWAPFVGMFIARISRGRTVGEFLFYVLLAPSLVSIFWMSVFGGAAVEQIVSGLNPALADTVPELQLFVMLKALPLTGITSLIGITLVVVFFITSWDSGALVLDTIAAGGRLETHKIQRIFWVGLIGLVAIALLVGGGLQSLQSAAIMSGFPFMFVIALMTVSLIIGLRRAAKQGM